GPPTVTPTSVPATSTNTPAPVSTSTNTPAPVSTATNTPVPTPTPATATPTNTAISGATPTQTPEGGVCAQLSGGAFGLCNAFCNAQHCDQNPDKRSCRSLRVNFQRQTGARVFPCETGDTQR